MNIPSSLNITTAIESSSKQQPTEPNRSIVSNQTNSAMFKSLQDQLDRMDHTNRTRSKNTGIVSLDDVWCTYGGYLYSQSSWRGHNAPTFGDVLKSLLLAGYTTCLWTMSVLCHAMGWMKKTSVRLAKRLMELLTSFTTKASNRTTDCRTIATKISLDFTPLLAFLQSRHGPSTNFTLSPKSPSPQIYAPAKSSLWHNLLRSKTEPLYDEVRRKATSCMLCSTDGLIHWTAWKYGRFTALCAKYCAVTKVESVWEVYSVSYTGVYNHTVLNSAK